MEILGPKSGTGLVAQAFSKTLGGLVAPQLLAAFLENPTICVTNDTTFETITLSGLKVTSDSTFSNVSHEMCSDEIEAQIEYTYAILGLLSGLSGFVFIFFYILEEPLRQTETETLPRFTCNNLMPNFLSGCTIKKQISRKNFFLLLFNFMRFNNSGVLFVIAGFVYSYSLEGIHHFSAIDSANINSAYFLFSLVGLGVNTAASAMAPVKYILGTQFAMEVATSVVLVIWGNSTSIVFLIFICILGCVKSSIGPLSLAWVRQYIDLSVVDIGFIYFSDSCGAATHIWLTGTLIDTFDYSMFLVMILCGNVSAFISFVILQTLAYYYGRQLEDQGYSEV